jgi:hypothetical protein
MKRFLILLLFLLSSSFLTVESAELNDKDISVLRKVLFGIGLNVIDSNCLEKKYLSLSSNQKKEFQYIFNDFPFKKSSSMQQKYLDNFNNQGIDTEFYGENVIDPCAW